MPNRPVLHLPMCTLSPGDFTPSQIRRAADRMSRPPPDQGNRRVYAKAAALIMRLPFAEVAALLPWLHRLAFGQWPPLRELRALLPRPNRWSPGPSRRPSLPPEA